MVLSAAHRSGPRRPTGDNAKGRRNRDAFWLLGGLLLVRPEKSDFECVRASTKFVIGFAGGNVKEPGRSKRSSAGERAIMKRRSPSMNPAVVSARPIGWRIGSHTNRCARRSNDAVGQFCEPRRTVYRTAIFAMVAGQKAAAGKQIHRLSRFREIPWSPDLGKTAFYPAECLHQDYYKSVNALPFTSVGLGL